MNSMTRSQHTITVDGLAKRKDLSLPVKQKGAVMITVLMLMVVITLMGLSSMKQGMFQARMGSAEVVYNSCFLAAESGLNGVYREFQDEVAAGRGIFDPGNFLNQASGTQAGIIHCLGDNGIALWSGTSCPAGDLTEYSQISVKMRSRSADPNNSLEKSKATLFEIAIGKGEAVLVYTDSRCQLDDVDLAVVNTQAWQYASQNSLPSNYYTN